MYGVVVVFFEMNGWIVCFYDLSCKCVFLLCICKIFVFCFVFMGMLVMWKIDLIVLGYLILDVGNVLDFGKNFK